jgi:hypothetical protein
LQVMTKIKSKIMARQQQLNFENSTYFESLVANGVVASTIDNTQNAYLIITSGIKDGNRISFVDSIMSAQDFLSYGTGGSSGGSIYTNGFKVIGPIAENITLPVGATVQYTGPLTMASGYTLTIPVGTTLTIV